MYSYNNPVPDHLISEGSILAKFGQRVECSDEHICCLSFSLFARIEQSSLIDDIFLKMKYLSNINFTVSYFIVSSSVNVNDFRISSASSP